MLPARAFDLMYLQYLASHRTRNIAVLVVDKENDQLYMRFTADSSELDPAGLDTLAELSMQLADTARQFSGNALLLVLHSLLPDAMRITDAQRIFVADVDAELDRLEQDDVSPAMVGKREASPESIEVLPALTPAARTATYRAINVLTILAKWFATFRIASAPAAALLAFVAVTVVGFHLSSILNGSTVPLKPPRSSLVLSTPMICLPPARAVSVAQNSGTRRRRRSAPADTEMRRTAQATKTFSFPERAVHVREPVLIPPPRLKVAAVGTVALSAAGDEEEVLRSGPPRRTHVVVRIVRAISTPFKVLGQVIAE
jgi:hypothetical protein